MAVPDTNKAGGLELAAPVFAEILVMVREYISAADLVELQKAYEYATEIYSGHHRISGRPYLYHALSVTKILARLKLDLHTLIAGILHGAIKEPASVPEKELEKRFGPEVLSIVKGVTKITSVHFDSRLAFQAENIRRMLLAMSDDIRILILKLADQLHDMQSLDNVSREKQLEYAQETMDLYAPLASRLGIDWLKRELEDLSFSYLNPEEYLDLVSRITTSLSDREAYVEEVKALLSKKIKEQDIGDFRILGRPKHLYSIYKKLIVQNIPLEKVYDKVAFRIILGSVRECYEVLGLLHDLWQPVSGRFKDFISSPKSNMYQSLHTTVVGPRGEFMEVQIRTEEMDEIANGGIAAHWAYKEGKAISSKDARLFQWLKQLVQSLQELNDLQDPGEFLEAVRGELREADIYALTPNGEVKELPMGSTPLDFAYSIHTEVGDHCAGARVNDRIVPLKHELQSGDKVEIITSSAQCPNRGWLTLVKTSRARSRIRHWLKKEEQERSLKVGREICERELKKRGLSLKKVTRSGHLKETLKSFSCNTLDELVRQVGSGRITVKDIANRMQPEEMRAEDSPVEQQLLETEKGKVQKKKKHAGRENALVIDGVDNMLTKISKCCMPVPGDPIAGFITAGRGISVHRADCRNFLVTDPDRHVDVSWAAESAAGHQVQIRVIAQDQRGLIASVSNTINISEADIVSMEAHTSADNLAVVNLVLEVAGTDHLAKVLQQIRKISGVLEAGRK
ncbi:MAG: bifunctional (p)ppGpp synthetase/guanosine-3',5'-bis(diphosphate) 3'-pyrophosphohydrolase [Proteobacteria bacterium]|nr:bifunctional (p)ppGpp synthetase/guanosine-3',5'-bis(diphosphate) 3'-pyrophosphohydrolase [Pseudomonadota bacterium]MBU1736573.1 bifunctional (p)ppGpp synthetase/guanosine-3',5'-bis(diphosphate) 3'-pyrophosphohydrolase [Pseudomonadota bacterium]